LTPSFLPAGKPKGNEVTPALLGRMILLTAAVAIPAFAQDYPARPVRLIVTMAPGGTADIIARMVADQLGNRFAQQIVVDNRAGAGGVVGSTIASKARADGYTIAFVGSSYTINTALHDLPFNPRQSLNPVARLGTAAYVLTAYAGLPVTSVKDLVSLAKQKPGTLNFGAVGTGSFTHMAAELFRMAAAIDIVIVQYKTGVIGDLLGGHIQGYIGGMSQMIPHVRTGKIKALATTGSGRSAALPEVPTVAEAGVPGYEISNWWGLLVPAGTPTSIVNRINQDVRTALESERIKNLFVGEGGDVAFLPPADFGRFLAADMDKWARVVKQANLQK
jgi:tripartite-type tricarboxylate transporter receptor subunit TctC